MFKYIMLAVHFSDLRWGRVDPMVIELFREENRKRYQRVSASVAEINREQTVAIEEDHREAA